MAINSSSIVPTAKKKNGRALVDEKIDERILRLLGLEDVFDIDYDTYSTLLKEVMVKGRMSKTSIPTEEIEMVTGEWKRVKGKSGRFKVKKITAESFKKGTAVGMNLYKKKLLTGIKPLALPPAVDKMSGGDDLAEIRDLLGNIIKNLTQQNKAQKDAIERSRKEAENARRALEESKLERGFKFAIKAAEKVIAPIKSLLSRIIDFFMAIFWGKVFLKLLDWFADSENKKKIDSLFRFFGDHWPKLLALYLRFGTGLGKFVGGLTKLVFFGTRKLLQVVAQMLGAKAAARFLGGRGGRLVSAGLQAATTIGTTMALSGGIEKFVGGEKEDKPKIPTFSGGEKEDNNPKMPTFSGGALANSKKMFGLFSGLVKGPGGPKGDKIPAMLSDGEFVVSAGAVQKYGVETFEAMNAAGGGTNKPIFKSDGVYAASGGYVSSNPFSGLLRVGSSIASLVTKPFSKSAQPSSSSTNKPRPFDSRAYTSSLTRSASQMISENWSYTPKPSVGCAPAINQVYRRAGLSIPWMSVKRINYVPDIYQSLNKSFVRINEPKRTPGDIVIWKDTGYPVGSGKDPYGHIGIVMPDGKIANNSTSKGTFTNLNTPNEARSWWPNTKELIYFRHPQVQQAMVESKPKTKLRTKSNTSQVSSGQPSFMSRLASVFVPPSQVKEPRYAKGGMVPARLSKAPANIKTISPPSKPSVVVRTVSSSKPENTTIPGTPGAPRLPSFSSARIDKERRRILDIHSIG